MAEANATLYTITMKDKVYDFYVDVCYRAYSNADVIEAWTVLRNGEKKPVVLNKYASGFLPIRQDDVWVTHMHGEWAAEAEVTSYFSITSECVRHAQCLQKPPQHHALARR